MRNKFSNIGMRYYHFAQQQRDNYQLLVT